MPSYYVVKATTGRIVSRHRKEDRAKAEAIRLRVKSGITGLRVISEDERIETTREKVGRSCHE